MTALTPTPRPTWHAAVALTYTGVVLTLSEFFFIPARTWSSAWVQRVAATPAERDLFAAFLWVASTVAFFLLGPILITKLVFRRPLRDVGFSGAGFFRHLVVYVGLFALMTPVLWIVSQRPEFVETYPFVAAARRDLSVFVRWEIAYVVQFFALEAFFRGFLLFTCAERMGSLAVFVMTVPYTMIHFHKPVLECFGALPAGIALGFLALRFRSFYGGVVLHALVAVLNDVLAVHRGGLF